MPAVSGWRLTPCDVRGGGLLSGYAVCVVVGVDAISRCNHSYLGFVQRFKDPVIQDFPVALNSRSPHPRLRFTADATNARFAFDGSGSVVLVVLTRGCDPKVIRSYAEFVVAAVINLNRRRWKDVSCQREREPMRKNISTLDIEVPVSPDIDRARPVPAGLGLLDLRPEPFLRGSGVAIDEQLAWIARPVPTAIVRDTPAACANCLLTPINGTDTLTHSRPSMSVRPRITAAGTAAGAALLVRTYARINESPSLYSLTNLVTTLSAP